MLLCQPYISHNSANILNITSCFCPISCTISCISLEPWLTSSLETDFKWSEWGDLVWLYCFGSITWSEAFLAVVCDGLAMKGNIREREVRTMPLLGHISYKWKTLMHQWKRSFQVCTQTMQSTSSAFNFGSLPARRNPVYAPRMKDTLAACNNMGVVGTLPEMLMCSLLEIYLRYFTFIFSNTTTKQPKHDRAMEKGLAFYFFCVYISTLTRSILLASSAF